VLIGHQVANLGDAAGRLADAILGLAARERHP
jgi:hypothetical protein